MKRKIGEILLILFFYIIQVTLGRVISIGGIKPNLLMILPVLFGFLNGSKEGMFMGFFAGFMYDLFFVFAGYFAGLFYQKYEETELLIPLALLLISDFCFEFMSYIGNFLLHNRLDVMYFISRFILPEVVYTLFMAVILYKPIVFINGKLDSRRKRRMSEFD